jgi:hypothetical protein
MLDLMMIVNQDLSARDFTDVSKLGPESYRRRLFNLYIKHQIQRDSSEPEARYSAKTVVSALTWLALKLNQNFFDQLRTQQLQPGWLVKSDQRWTKSFNFWLYMICSRVAASFTVMAVGVLIMWLSWGVGKLVSLSESTTQRPSLWLLNVEEGLVKWVLITGFFGGLTMALVDLVRLKVSEKRDAARRTLSSLASAKTVESYFGTIRAGATDVVEIVRNIGLCGAVFFFAAWRSFDLKRAIYGGLVYGVAFGLVFWFRARERQPTRDIELAEKLTWSSQGFLKGLLGGFATGALLGLVGGLIILFISGPRVAIYLGFLGWLSGGLIGSVVIGLSKVSISEDATSSTAGVSRALRNAGFMSLYVGLPFVVLFWIYARVIVGSFRTTLETGLFFGLVIGMLVGAAYSGIDVIYYYILHFILWLERLPGNQVRFLDYATHLAFLRRTGRNYEFRHDSLRQHFAALTKDDEREIGLHLEKPKNPAEANRAKHKDPSRASQPDSLCSEAF